MSQPPAGTSRIYLLAGPIGLGVGFLLMIIMILAGNSMVVNDGGLFFYSLLSHLATLLEVLGSAVLAAGLVIKALEPAQPKPAPGYGAYGQPGQQGQPGYGAGYATATQPATPGFGAPGSSGQQYPGYGQGGQPAAPTYQAPAAPGYPPAPGSNPQPGQQNWSQSGS